jgi:hypothetical protein
MPIWLQIVLGVSAPAIACFGAYISYKQWQLGQYKLKHDLFEKRWLVYATTHDAIVIFLNGTEEEKLKQFKNLKIKIVGAKFLFSPDVCTYLNDISNQIYEIRTLEHNIRVGVENREDIIQAHKKSYEWLENQLEVLSNKMKPYLDLTI